MTNFDQYIQMAKDLEMIDAKVITAKDICFDIRAILKCRWGCEDYAKQTVKCNTRDTLYNERMNMAKSYKHVLLVHSHDASKLSSAVLKIGRAAFLDGHYFACAIRYCRLCKNCAVDQGKTCPTPEKVRPCDSNFGIDVYKTARNQGLPCDVLQTKEDIQNRYGFVFIE
jgi:predicted metal-binding protein